VFTSIGTVSIPKESEFRVWLSVQGRWSNKAQNDLVSRLRRADKMAPIERAASTFQYIASLEASAVWQSIPRASQTGILAASRLYLDWLRTES
jgi:hypothetical protein